MRDTVTRGRIDALLRARHGVLTRADLLSLDLTPRQADRVVQARGLIRAKRGVYLSPSHPRTEEQTMVLACLSHPEVLIGFTTAGRVSGVRGMTLDRRVHVLAPHRVQVTAPGAFVHRSRRLVDDDVAPRRPDGIRTTSLSRTIVDAAGIVGPRATASAIEQLVNERRVTIPTLLAASQRLRHPSRPGSIMCAELIASRPTWRRAARSGQEVQMITALAEAELPLPEINFPLVLLDGSHIEIDLAWPVWTLAYEVDHPFWHDGWVEGARDKRRDRMLGAMGWLPQRLAGDDVEYDVPGAVADIEASLRARGWRPGLTSPLGGGGLGGVGT